MSFSFCLRSFGASDFLQDASWPILAVSIFSEGPFQSEKARSHLKKTEVELLNNPDVTYQGNCRHDIRIGQQAA